MAVQHPHVNMPAKHEGAFNPGNLSHPPIAAAEMKTSRYDRPLERLSSHAQASRLQGLAGMPPYLLSQDSFTFWACFCWVLSCGLPSSLSDPFCASNIPRLV